jgi:chemotaxis protein methyltransferase CheR
MPDPGFWHPGHFDIIFCRNMLMYLDGPSLRQAVQHLATTLAPGGALFLGHAETLHSLTDQLVLQQGAGCFFYQRREDVAAPPASAVPRVGAAGSAEPGATTDAKADARASLDPPAPDSIWDAPFPTEWPPLEADEDGTRQLDRALHLVETGQVNEGLRVCADLIARPMPADIQADALYIQALALEERGELAAAEWHHQRAAAKDAHFAMPHLRLGLLARRRGEPVAARRELRHALALLDTESPERLRRFGGGFERQALRQLCTHDLGDLP